MESKKRSFAFVALGWLFISLAVVGIFLPIVPQVPFAVLGAYFFSKGSPRLHKWVLNHKHFGAAVRDWELDQVIRPRLKLFSIAMMVGGATLAYFKYRGDRPLLAIGIPAVFALACLFVATRRSQSRPGAGAGLDYRLPRDS